MFKRCALDMKTSMISFHELYMPPPPCVSCRTEPMSAKSQQKFKARFFTVLFGASSKGNRMIFRFNPLSGNPTKWSVFDF